MIKCNECNKEFISKKSLSNHIRGGCRSNKKYEKNCPICDNIIEYNSPSEYKKSVKNNSKCTKCRNNGKKVSDKTKEKISKKLKYLYDSGGLIPNMSGAHSEESRKKISLSKTGQKLTDEHKNRIRNGIINSDLFKLSIKSKERSLKISKANKGKKCTNETKKKMKENHPDVSGEKNTFFGKNHTDETKRIMRIKSLKRREITLNGKKLRTFFNKKACDYFDKLMKENNINIQHALNGGEYYLKELGYFLDGYDIKNNIVYEWDEYQHFDKNGELKEKDVIRQKEIIDYLGCKFVRFKQTDFILKIYPNL